jgi:hypothetical protein
LSTDADAAAGPELIEVRLVSLPVGVWQRAQEHADELIREFTLIAGDRGALETGHEVPARLTELIEQLTDQYAGFTTEQETALAEAAAKGVDEIEILFRVPAAAVPAAAHLGEMLDAADDYCRRGKHLLTLETPPESLAFRQWYLGEFTRQAAGEPPTAWPHWAGEQGLKPL